MANDSTNQTQGTQHDDMGVSAAHDSETATVQVAEATSTTGAAPAANGAAAPAAVPDQTINVVIPQGATVVRVPVAAGDTIDLPPPFNSGAILDPSHGNGAKEGDGNLAIKVGDVTVILQGYVEASNDPQHPVTIEASDNQAVDIATVLASTDPNANIPTAAGPATGAQGADNTGAILSQFGNGEGLGGFNAIGALDATALNYKLIDNSIRQDLATPLNTPGGPGLGFTVSPGVGGGHEGLLHDPAHSAPGSFGSFLSEYETTYNSGGTGPQPGWSDFTGTQATNNATFQEFLTQNEQTTLVHATNLSSPQGSMVLNGIDVSSMTSNGSPLDVAQADNGQTLFVTRESDGALIFVVHVDQTSASDFTIETILVNRLDDTSGDGSQINGNVDFTIYDGQAPQQGSDEPSTGPTPPSASGSIGITFVDDAPVATTNSYQEPNDPSDPNSTISITHNVGHVDEDWLNGGNQDKDADGHSNKLTNGDGTGGASVTGTVGINFGADGPAGESIAGGTTSKAALIDTNNPALALDVPAKDSAFTVNGQQLHSDGNPLVVLEADATHIIVGYENAPGNGDGPVASALAVGGTEVFELTLDNNPDSPTFGQFTFTLMQGIDENGQHSGKEGDLPADITFNVTGYDDDGDKATTTIHIQVNDDVPQIPEQHNDPKTPSTSDGIAIVDEDYLAGGYQGGDPTKDPTTGTTVDGVPGGGTTATGHINVNFGGDGQGATGSFGFDTAKISEGKAVQVTDANGTHDLKTDAGETVSYHIDNSVAGHEIVTGVTAGGTEVFKLDLNTDTADTANVGTWTFTLEQPVSHADGFSEDDLLASFGVQITDADGSVSTGSIKVDINDDAPVAVSDSDSVNHSAGQTTSGNVVTGVGDADSSLNADHFGADQPTKGATDVVNATGAGGTSINSATGEITVHGAFGDLVMEKDGSYTYTVGAGGIVQGQQDVFTYTIKDADGDASDATLTIGTSTVPDVTPETPRGSPGIVTVYEAGLESGVHGSPVDGSDKGGAGSPTVAAGSFKIDSHHEGFNYLHVGGQDVPLNDGPANIAINVDHGILTVTNVTDNKDGSYDISYTYTLTSPVDETTANNGPDTQTLAPTIPIEVQDKSGDTAPGQITIKVVDDVPTAHDDSALLDKDHGNLTTGVVTGSVEGNDVFGADGKDSKGGVVGIAVGDTKLDSSSLTDVHGQYGTLHMNADGSYTYTRDNGAPTNGDVHDIFTYTIQDGDGDTSHAKLDIDINDNGVIVTPPPPPGPTDNPVTLNGSGTAVFESGLNPNGSDAAAHTETTTGKVTVTALDGVATITIDGTPVNLTDVTKTGPIHGTHGDITVTGWNPTTGELDYSYTLTTPDNTPGAPGSNFDTKGEDFTVTATDKDGDSKSGDIVIGIVDDVPSAHNDAVTIGTAVHVYTSTVATNVEANDTFGADGKAVGGGVVGVAAGDTKLDSSSMTDVHGQYGTLHMNADGSYTYTKDNDAPTSGDVHDIFTYTIQDKDGDTSHAKLDIDFNDNGVIVTPPPPPHDGDNPITLNAGGTAVYESAIGDSKGANAGGVLGSNPTATTETTTGHVMVEAKDGVGSIMVGTTLVNLADVSKTDVIHGKHGDLTVTGWNAATGELDYSYTLTSADNTPSAPGNNFDTKGEDFTVTATDTDGDSNSGHVVIGIVDDVPTAHNDAVSISNTATVYTSTVATNVEANDTFGADGKAVGGGVVGIAKGDTGADSSSMSNVVGAHGTLHMNADGSYTYTRDANDKATGEVHDIFTYTIKDADGDTSHAKLDIDIVDNPVTVTPPPPPHDGDNPITLNAGGTAVYESALGSASGANAAGFLGTNPTATTETTSGHVMIDAKDGVGSITVDNTVVNLTDVSKTGVIHGDHGDLTITGWNSTTGELDYSYTLTHPENTPVSGATNQGANLDISGEDFTIVAKDTDNDTGTGHLKIGIVDDVPTAQSGTKDLNATGGDTNVLLTLDLSDSMNDSSGVAKPGGGTYTKLQLEKVAIQGLLEKYAENGNVAVHVVWFNDTDNSGNGGVGSNNGGWMTVAQAEAYVNGLTAGSNTNYDIGITKTEDSFSNLTGYIPNGQNVSYFLSDGMPNQAGNTQGGDGVVGITGDQLQAWQAFVSAHGIDSYAIGLGTGVGAADKGSLDPVAYNGQNNTDPAGNTIIVTDLNQLQAVINGTVPSPSTGNLVGDLGGKFGADGAGHINEVQIAGTTHTFAQADPTTHLVTFNLTQGTVTVNMETGEYTYTPKVGQPQVEVDIAFNLTDKEGDISNTAVLHLVPVNHAPVIDSYGSADKATISVVENTTQVALIHATDPDIGSKLGFSITGGADANLFSINTTTGALVFKSAHDFENPQDAGKDNVYNVTVTVTDDHGAKDTQDLAVTVTNANDVAAVATDDFVYTTQTDKATLQDGWLLSNDTDKDTPQSGLTITGETNDSNLSASHSNSDQTISLSSLFGSSTDKDGETGSLDYTVSDGKNPTDTGHVLVTYESSHTIDRSVDTHNDIIIGNSSDETLKGGHGDDVIVTGGGNDKVDGGDGFNTAVIGGDGVSYTHTTLATNFDNVQLLDLGKGGNNDNTTVGADSTGNRLDAKDVLDMSGSAHALYITGDSKDDVSVKTSGTNGFDTGTTVNVTGVDHVPDGSYVHYQATIGGQHVDLYVQATIDQHKGG